MSAPIVQAQYDQLEQIAARFAAAAEQQQALLERVNRQVEVLRSGSWQGKGVAAFLREMDGEVGSASLRFFSALSQASQTTLQLSQLLRQAEENAGNLFKTEENAGDFEKDTPIITYPLPGMPNIDVDLSRFMDPPEGATDNGNKTQAQIIAAIKDKIRGDLGRLPNDKGEQCVAWVADRVQQITGHRPPAIGNYGSDLGADNYRFMFDDVQRFDAGNKDALLGATNPGAILVWTRAQLGNGAGHVAVVERVTSEGVYISEANWGKREGVRFIPKDELARLGLFMVPAGATAVAATAEQFADRKKAATT